jgi:hypothetical protein
LIAGGSFALPRSVKIGEPVVVNFTQASGGLPIAEQVQVAATGTTTIVTTPTVPTPTGTTTTAPPSGGAPPGG